MSEHDLRTALSLTAEVAEKALERLLAADRAIKLARFWADTTDHDLKVAIAEYDRLTPKHTDHS